MRRITLTGYLRDREPHIVAATLSERGLPLIEYGYFEGAEYVAPDDTADESLAAIAEVFSPSPLPIVRIVSPRQIRQALTQAGLRDQVEVAITAGDQDLKDWWQYATEFKQDHPMVLSMASTLGQTEQQIADLFELAASL